MFVYWKISGVKPYINQFIIGQFKFVPVSQRRLPVKFGIYIDTHKQIKWQTINQQTIIQLIPIPNIRFPKQEKLF